MKDGSFVVVLMSNNTSSGGEPSKFAGEAGSFPSSGPSNFDPSSPGGPSGVRASARARDARGHDRHRESEVDPGTFARVLSPGRREPLRNCKELVEKYAEAFQGKSLARINVMRDSK